MTGRIQIVVFMRHGIAVHNVRDSRKDPTPDHRDVRLWDPPLVYQGVLRAVEAGTNVQRWIQEHTKRRRIELFVTSPLTRCIQTTTLAFLRGDDYDWPPPPIVCVEDVREAFGIYYPDKRREKSKLKVSKANLASLSAFIGLFY
jgi:broad specificity phosphatase PhoE